MAWNGGDMIESKTVRFVLRMLLVALILSGCLELGTQNVSPDSGKVQDEGESGNDDDSPQAESLTKDDRLRIEEAISGATRELKLGWLESLDESSAAKIATWGRNSSGYLVKLKLNGVSSLDAVAANQLARWGRDEINAHWLYLNGLQSLDVTTAERLAQWGRGNEGWRYLHLNGLEALEPATAEQLAQWGKGDHGERFLSLGG